MHKPCQSKGPGITPPLAIRIAAGVLWLGCSPGTLPCDASDEWKAICARDGGTAVSRAGDAAGSGGGGSGSGGAASGTGGTSAKK